MSAPLNSAQAQRLLDLSFQKKVMKTSTVEPMFKKYFNFRTTNDYYDKDTGLSGLSEADFVDENGIVVADVPIQTNQKTYTQASSRHMTSFTEIMWRFGIKKNDLDRFAKELKQAHLRQQEKLTAERLDNGFESTSYTHTGSAKNTTITTSGGDSLGAFDDDHTREDGGTNMNNLVYDGTTYNLPFDYAGLKAAHRTASLIVDPRGNPDPPMLDTLVVKYGSSISFKAKEMLGAIKSGKIPESFDNDAAGTPAFQIIELKYLTNAAYWYMFDSTRLNSEELYGFQFVQSRETTLNPSVIVPKTEEIQFYSSSTFDMGHNDVVRMWVASKGDSSSPSS